MLLPQAPALAAVHLHPPHLETSQTHALLQAQLQPQVPLQLPAPHLLLPLHHHQLLLLGNPPQLPHHSHDLLAPPHLTTHPLILLEVRKGRHIAAIRPADIRHQVDIPAMEDPLVHHPTPHNLVIPLTQDTHLATPLAQVAIPQGQALHQEGILPSLDTEDMVDIHQVVEVDTIDHQEDPLVDMAPREGQDSQADMAHRGVRGSQVDMAPREVHQGSLVDIQVELLPLRLLPHHHKLQMFEECYIIKKCTNLVCKVLHD